MNENKFFFWKKQHRLEKIISNLSDLHLPKSYYACNEILFQTSYVNHSAQLNWFRKIAINLSLAKININFLWIFCIAYSALCISEMTLYAKSNVELTISCRILIARFRPDSKLVEEQKGFVVKNMWNYKIQQWIQIA